MLGKMTYDMCKRATFFILFLLFTVFSGCSTGKKDNRISDAVISHRATVPNTVTIYRYGTFPKAKAEKLQECLKPYFGKVLLKEECLPLPSTYYNKERNRYLASGLFGEISKRQNGDAVIGVTDYVIFKPNNISKTFGIMGLSPVGTYKCVVSSVMPKNSQTLTDDIFLKLVLHELGHAYGLPHCPNQQCYMVDAEHKMKFLQTVGFCDNCKKKLQSKGWSL